MTHPLIPNAHKGTTMHENARLRLPLSSQGEGVGG
jgi:hypothetical protein